jgi:hypothetical protein
MSYIVTKPIHVDIKIKLPKKKKLPAFHGSGITFHEELVHWNSSSQ